MNKAQKVLRLLTKALVGKLGFLNLQRTTNNGQGYLEWGKGSNYPTFLIDMYESSSSLAKCIDLKAKFIKGDGYPHFNQYAVNSEGLTLFELINSCAYQRALNRGIVWMITYNMHGEPQIEPIPFDRWRWKDKELNSVLLIDSTNGAVMLGDDKKPVSAIPLFKDRVTSEQRMRDLNKEGKGWLDLREVYLDFQRIDGSYLYPASPFHSVLMDCATEKSVKEAKYTDARSRFAPKVVMTFYGADNDDSNNKLIKLQQDTMELLGEEGSVVMVQKALNKESKPDIDTINLQNPDKMYEYTESSVSKNITNLFNIPDILFGNNASGAFASHKEQFKDAIQYMQRFVVDEDQKAIQKALNKFLPHKTIFNSEGSEKWNIKKEITPITWVDIDAITPESVDKEAEARAALKGSVGGVQGILGIQASVSQGITTIDAGAAILELIYGLPSKEARRMLGEPEKIEPTTTPITP